MAQARCVGAWAVSVCVMLGACSATRSTSGTAPLTTSVSTSPAAASTALVTTADVTDPATDPVITDPVITDPVITDPTTIDPTTTVSPSTASSTTATSASATPTFDSLDDAAPAGPCGFTPAVPMGEVTWVHDGQLRALADGAQPTCLLDRVPGTSPIAWSSDAGRVLTDPTSSSTASGTHPTGFDGSNTSVTLSAPTGTATIGIDPATHHLIRHGSDGAVSDISFLATTDTAIYHPNGKRIIAVGTDANGAYGLWLSSNLGKEPKQILSVADPSTPVTDLSFSADGLSLYFIHGFVHRLILTNLDLLPIGVADRQEANLTVSKLENAEAWSTGPCDATGTVMFASDILGAPRDIRTIPGSPFADSPVTIRPVGWLSGDRLVVATRSTGCDGSADVWIWSPVDGFHHVAHDALAPAVRLPRGPSFDLPDVIEQAAPG